MNLVHGKTSLLIIVSFLLLTSLALAEGNKYCEFQPDPLFTPLPVMDVRETAESNYETNLRIYVVEPVSTDWDMYSGMPYHFAFLNYAYDTTLSLQYLEEFDRTVSASVPGKTEDNIMVIAVLFNGQTEQGYADPPFSNPFDAHYVDAAAGATPFESWPNTVTQDFTHTVFVEEGTATWCPYCPDAANSLKYIYDNDGYPFFFVALVGDMNATAYSRLVNYNISGWPTMFYGGGYEVMVGSTTQLNPYRELIESCGARDVHECDLSVSMNWLGSGNFEVSVHVKNNERINFAPDTPSTPQGITQGGIEVAYNFSTSTIDPDDNTMTYRFFWAEGDTSAWIGPYNSGESCTQSHIWNTAGTYDVKVKAKDQYDVESAWSTPLPITIYNYVAGDANGSRAVNILDATFLINYLYKSGAAPDPLESGDANGNTATNILDVTYLINYLYKGGPAPVYR